MILNGKNILEEELKKFPSFVKTIKVRPGLAAILVGDDPASLVYVRSKIKACLAAGFDSFPLFLPRETTQTELLEYIYSFNNDPRIHGILVQLPLPPHIEEQAVIEAIIPHKDVDCFHPSNLGRLFSGLSSFSPCTPAGIIHLIGTIEGYSLVGKKALIVGASNIVGKPMGVMLLQKQATLAIAHKQTKDLKELTLWADIIISSTGVPHLIGPDMVQDGVVLIDVGMHRNQEADGRFCLVGDINFEALHHKARAITPVPGGVGPMTILHLMKNTFYLAQQAEDRIL